MTEVKLREDMLYGAAAIADYLGLDRRSVYHLASKGQMPTFRLGETVCARKSTLESWIDAQERKI